MKGLIKMKTVTTKLNKEQMKEQLQIWQKAHESYLYREDWNEEDYNAMWEILVKGKEDFDPKKIASDWFRFELSFGRNRFKNVDDYFCSGAFGVGFGYITNKKQLNEELPPRLQYKPKSLVKRWNSEPYRKDENDQFLLDDKGNAIRDIQQISNDNYQYYEEQVTTRQTKKEAKILEQFNKFGKKINDLEYIMMWDDNEKNQKILKNLIKSRKFKGHHKKFE